MYGGIGRGWERFGGGLGEASGGSANGSTSIRGMVTLGEVGETTGEVGRGWGETSGGSANGSTSIRGTALETFRRHVMLLGEVYGVCWFIGRRLSDILDHRETFKGHFGSFGDV